MRWIDLGSIALRYELSGAGEMTFVLMHEMGGTLESWDAMVPLLSSHGRVLRYDLRGSGLSEKPKGPMTIGDLSRDAAELLTALGIGGKVITVGCAVGAANALHFAGTYPERAAAVVAISPLTGVASASMQAMLDRSEMIRRQGPRAIVDSSLALGYPEPFRTNQDSFLKTRAQRISASPAGFAEMFRMLIDLDITNELAKIKAPTLLICCDSDKNVPREAVYTLLTKLRFGMIGTIHAGHFAPAQAPDTLAATVLKFVDSNVSAV